jgi:STE24 endopeptidase
MPATAMPSVVQVPLEAQPSDHFDAVAATNAYLAQIPAEARARSDAYFEGGYWLTLWDFLYGAIVAILLLQLGGPPGCATWLNDHSIQAAADVDLLDGILVVTAILGFRSRCMKATVASTSTGWPRRRLGRGSATVQGPADRHHLGRNHRHAAIRGGAPSAKYVVDLGCGGHHSVRGLQCDDQSGVHFPLFNTSKLLDDPRITGPILSMAHANGIAADKVYEIDASKQTTRMSANVSGLGSTMRITLNDNLLKRASPEEVQFVMGHEMGHYVLNHIAKDMIFFFVVVVALFGFLRWSVEWSLARWGEKWQVRGITDTAVVPLVALLGSIFFFVLTPILNTHTRTSSTKPTCTA